MLRTFQEAPIWPTCWAYMWFLLFCKVIRNQLWRLVHLCIRVFMKHKKYAYTILQLYPFLWTKTWNRREVNFFDWEIWLVRSKDISAWISNRFEFIDWWPFYLYRWCHLWEKIWTAVFFFWKIFLPNMKEINLLWLVSGNLNEGFSFNKDKYRNTTNFQSVSNYLVCTYLIIINVMAGTLIEKIAKIMRISLDKKF